MSPFKISLRSKSLSKSIPIGLITITHLSQWKAIKGNKTKQPYAISLKLATVCPGGDLEESKNPSHRVMDSQLLQSAPVRRATSVCGRDQGCNRYGREWTSCSQSEPTDLIWADPGH